MTETKVPDDSFCTESAEIHSTMFGEDIDVNVKIANAH